MQYPEREFVLTDEKGSPIDFEGMSIDELKEYKLKNFADLTSIKTQLQAAAIKRASTGEAADQDWFRRATGAKRVKGLIDQKIALELGRRAQLRKDQNIRKSETDRADFLDAFMSCAQEMLPETLCAALIRAAAERIEQQTYKLS
ncbi:hypothetical protein H6G00_05125 [Leptolyngbya sp. FACHB-541]|uniref:hypothetical protein n=1 Tax=Leptolyngbya sp. FACHB-541 TaxID=2692810 RepID=UPI0016821A48|nr:hypothetical protein [Leptolyngbya sp. FACHB-541]MBD1995998.1 hypothetical protein [Leptolyngbya sp. FACHB-541]